MNQTDSKSVLITGCSTGIGLCVARGLHQRGYRVFATARRQKDVKQLANEGLESLQLDLDDSDSIARAVDEVLQRTGGGLYALLTTAPTGRPGRSKICDGTCCDNSLKPMCSAGRN